MFLRERATQAEYCDQPGLPLEAVASNYRQLARFNETMLVADAFQRLLVRWLGRERGRQRHKHEWRGREAAANRPER